MDFGFIFLFSMLAFAYFTSGLLLQNDPLLRPVVGLLIAIVIATVSTGVSILQADSGFTIQRILSVGIAVSLCFVVWALLRRQLSARLTLSLAGQSAGVFVAMFAIEWTVRHLKLASIAFGDVFTIVSFSDRVLKVGRGLDAFSTSMVLKRGAGYPAIQSLSPLDQVAHSLPLFAFIAWLLAVIAIMSKVLKHRDSIFVSVITFLVVSLSTEAVMRNTLFLSSHIIVAGAVLVLTSYYLKAKIDTLDSVVMAFVIAATIMLRADNGLIMLLPILLVVTGCEIANKKMTALLLSISYLSLPFWLLSYQVDISLVVSILATIFAIGLGAGIFYLPTIASRSIHGYASTRSLWLPLLGVAVSLMTSASLRSIEALYFNYILSEGLWGFTFAALLAASVVLAIRMRLRLKEIDRLAPMAFGLLGMIIWAKFGDAFISQESLARLAYSSSPLEFARIGWGDSLNRLFVYVFPLFFTYVAAEIFGNGTSRKIAKTDKK